MNHFPFHVGDYIKSTVHLTNEEDLTYRRLIEHYYDSERPISKETQTVSKRLRVDNQTVLRILQEFFFEEEDGWHNKRCDEEIKWYQQKCARNREVGKLGGRPKKTQVVTKRKPSGNRLETVSNPNQNHNQNHVSTPTGVDNASRKKVGVDDLVGMGVDRQAAADWLTVRKEKRAPLTPTALDGIVAEAKKAGISLDQTIRICAFKSWQGFDSTWDWKSALPKKTAAELLDAERAAAQP